MLSIESLYKKVKEQLVKNQPFVLYKKGNQEVIHGMAQMKTTKRPKSAYISYTLRSLMLTEMWRHIKRPALLQVNFNF